jgi:leucyl-tRNA synthetase
LILAPFAPHISEEIWSELGYKISLAHEKFPYYSPEYLEDEEIIIVVQVNGKVRGQFTASKEISEEEAFEKALVTEKVPSFIKDKEIIKKIYVKEKLVNLVVKG